VRKYLDALCVYFWAATSLLTSILTFAMFVLTGHALTAEVVFTSLALFGVLIAPLNSFPWVINGCVEAIVSMRRLQRCS
jgi:ATP-binding cassette subfamily C (CFTR/MRP) protein 10